LIIVDVSALTGAFVGTVCLIAVRHSVSGKQEQRTDEQRRGVLPTLPHLRHPVRPETEQRTAITGRQTVPTKALVEAETSTIINKRLFFKEFHSELEFTLSYVIVRPLLVVQYAVDGFCCFHDNSLIVLRDSTVLTTIQVKIYQSAN